MRQRPSCQVRNCVDLPASHDVPDQSEKRAARTNTRDEKQVTRTRRRKEYRDAAVEHEVRCPPRPRWPFDQQERNACNEDIASLPESHTRFMVSVAHEVLFSLFVQRRRRIATSPLNAINPVAPGAGTVMFTSILTWSYKYDPLSPTATYTLSPGWNCVVGKSN